MLRFATKDLLCESEIVFGDLLIKLTITKDDSNKTRQLRESKVAHT